MISRRGLITGLISFVAAPAIVRAGSLMPVRRITWSNAHDWVVPQEVIKMRINIAYEVTRLALNDNLYNYRFPRITFLDPISGE